MRLKPRHALLVVGVLFLIGFIHNVVTDELTLGDSLAQWAAVVLCGGGYVFLEREERARDALLEFLVTNGDAIRAGTATFEGHTITYATRVRVDTIVISLLLASFRLHTRPVFVGAQKGDGWRRLGYSGTTLLFGWWGFPWGPIWTVQALVNNARGKPVFSVGELLEGKTTQALPTATYKR